MPAVDRIRQCLLFPQQTFSMSMLDWDLLIRQARRANLLARLCFVLGRDGLLESVPAAPLAHLRAAELVAQRQAVSVRWEVQCLAAALASADIPLTVLKGAAYLVAGLDVSVGRVFSDIDLIVPKPVIGLAESALMQHGWRGADMSKYDQRYYRQWMHEVPPMTHVRRGTTIDLHHSILPETARVSVNIAAMLDAAVPLPGQAQVKVLAPVDMVLHSATHLFHEGEFENGLRDLFDLDSLIRHFANSEPEFWGKLVPRAIEVGLTRPLYYALRYSHVQLGTPVPPAVLEAAQVGRPTPLPGLIMDRCYGLALKPLHPSIDSKSATSARFALYVRSHWIRMPFALLAYHLGRKVFLRLTEKPEQPPAADRPENLR